MGRYRNCLCFHVHQPCVFIHDSTCVRPARPAVWYHGSSNHRTNDVDIRSCLRYVSRLPHAPLATLYSPCMQRSALSSSVHSARFSDVRECCKCRTCGTSVSFLDFEFSVATLTSRYPYHHSVESRVWFRTEQGSTHRVPSVGRLWRECSTFSKSAPLLLFLERGIDSSLDRRRCHR